MSKKNSSRATKLAMASALAVSAFVPAIVVGAEDAVKTIDFTVETENAIMKNYVKGPGIYHVIDGKKYIQLDASEAFLNMLTAATVDGKSVLSTEGGKKVLIPINDNFDEVKVSLTLASQYVNDTYTVTIKPDGTSIKDKVVAPAEPTPEVVKYKKVKSLPTLANGIYDVTYDAYDPKTGAANYTAITKQLPREIKLEVEDGEYYAIFSTNPSSNAFIIGVEVNGVEAERISGEMIKDDVQEFRVKIDSLTEIYEAKAITHRGNPEVPHAYPFNFAIDAQNIEVPQPVFVYKYDEANKVYTDQLSTMGTYVDENIVLTATETGYDIELTFAQGQYVNDFDIVGVETTLAEEIEVGNDTVKVYTFSVADYTKLYESTMTISVPEIPGYENKEYKVQLQFGGKVKVPFSDLAQADWAENYILGLYAKGIFKYDSSFRPGNVTERYQLALMLQRAFNYAVPSGDSTFGDISGYDSETQRAIKALSNAKIIKGLDAAATQFGPDKSIYRQDAAIMISRVLTEQGLLPKEEVILPYNDYTSPTADADAYTLEVDKALKHLNGYGIMNGDAAGNINAKGTLTRAEMAKMLSVALELLKTQK